MRQMTICNYLKCISSKFSVNTKFELRHSQVSSKKYAPELESEESTALLEILKTQQQQDFFHLLVVVGLI